jgi:hypothetical protein
VHHLLIHEGVRFLVGNELLILALAHLFHCFRLHWLLRNSYVLLVLDRLSLICDWGEASLPIGCNHHLLLGNGLDLDVLLIHEDVGVLLTLGSS